MRIFTLAAAAVAVGLTAGAALAADDDLNSDNLDLLTPSTTIFDLGVDVSNVGTSSAAVRGYLGSLEPVTRASVLAACDHFMDAPVTAQDQNTLTFCAVAING